jgi:hypothetical protein
MIRSIGNAGLCPVESAGRCDVSLDADYRLGMCSDCFGIELYGSEHIAMVGNRHGFHIKLLASLEQIIERDSTIQQ